MRLNRRAFLAASAAATFSAPSRADGVRPLGGPAFGSMWRAISAADPTVIQRVVERVVAETDAAMSPYRAGSELARFNRSRETGWHDASPELCWVAAEALFLAERSGGAFDPSVGPLVRRFGFGPISGAPRAALTAGPRGIAKADPEATLDLCGIAKGDALDRIVAALAAEGVTDTLVELGGETRALGRHPEGRPWAVAVERPGAESLTVHRIVRPGQLALATSGTQPNGFAANGTLTAHIIDPRTRRPVSGDVAAVTVAAATARTADAWSTALLVLGPEAGPELAERHHLAALFLMPEDGGFREIATGGFAELIVE